MKISTNESSSNVLDATYKSLLEEEVSVQRKEVSLDDEEEVLSKSEEDNENNNDDEVSLEEEVSNED